jgi:hypothetical protein
MSVESPVLLLVIVALACGTIVVLVACTRRKGGVRGFLRAGPLHLAIEIDASPDDERKLPPKG